jgi:hypothetical protein
VNCTFRLLKKFQTVSHGRDKMKEVLTCLADKFLFGSVTAPNLQPCREASMSGLDLSDVHTAYKFPSH